MIEEKDGQSPATPVVAEKQTPADAIQVWDIDAWLEDAPPNSWLAIVYDQKGNAIHQSIETGRCKPFDIAERAVAMFFTSDIVLNARMLSETLLVLVVHSSGSVFGPIAVETSLETIAVSEI